MKKIEIFFCYAREDEQLRLGLVKQLRALQRQGLIDPWHDRNISAGSEWQSEIDVHLNAAQLILLLVSPDFMDSDYCYSSEMTRAMERHQRGEAYVIPIILRPIYWQEAPFGKLQALPTNGKPVTSSNWHSPDEAFFDVAEGIRKVVNALLTQQTRPIESRVHPEPQKLIEETNKHGQIMLGSVERMEEERQRKVEINTSPVELFTPTELIMLPSQTSIPTDQSTLSSQEEVLIKLESVTNMSEIAAAHQEIYQRATRPVEARADSLNNRALALFDLGKVEEAKQVWEQALEADPQHLEATYNRGIVLWRRGELTDNILIQQLTSIEAIQGERWLALYLLAQVQLERGEVNAALPLLREAAQQAPEETDVQVLLERAQSGEITAKRCLHVLEGHLDWVRSVSLSIDGRLALSGSSDKTVQVWEVAMGHCQRVLLGHTESVNAVSLSADGRLALSGSYDGTVRVWEVSSGRCLRVLQGHTQGVSSLSLSADGCLALSGGGGGWVKDTTVRVWEVSSGRCLRVLQGHTQDACSVSLSADGRLILSGGYEHTRLWEVATGHCLQVLQGHADSVHAVGLSADGRFALSGSWDKMVRVWEVSTGRCLRVLQGHTGSVTGVSLSADGRFALSGSSDHTVRVWELDWELEARDPVDWDERALPHLETFLILHMPYVGTLPQDREASEQEIQQALTRGGRPSWTEQDFQELISQLQYAGYGWLRPKGVRLKLEELTASWQRPPA